MKLSDVVEKYIAIKQAMGMRFKTEATALRGFARAMGPREMAEVKPRDVRSYLFKKRSPSAAYFRGKILSRFYRFSVAREYAVTSPLPSLLPQSKDAAPPYIYTLQELRRLYDAAQCLDREPSDMNTRTFRALLATLYGTGLRISEAMALTVADVNLREALLTIRESKFFKTRWVPLGPKLCGFLKTYAETGRPQGDHSLFFRFYRQTPFGRKNCAEYTFRRICNAVGVRRSDGAYFQPRLHDLRHTFAVHRLVAWYRQGADVQRLLPSLATFLGHRDIDSLQWYLTMTPDLLNEANTRFERYALMEVRHV
jgi:site-specific recombinase XerD